MNADGHLSVNPKEDRQQMAKELEADGFVFVGRGAEIRLVHYSEAEREEKRQQRERDKLQRERVKLKRRSWWPWRRVGTSTS